MNTLEEIEQRLKIDVEALQTRQCERSLSEFTRCAWHIIEPETPLLWNWHLDTICGYLEACYAQKITRLIINVPPGSLKSILVSVMYPAWLWTKAPHKRILGISNIQDLAIRDASKTRRIITDEWYYNRWPLELRSDQSAKTNYENSKSGFRLSIGITANITGKRGDCLLIDDPHDATGVLSPIARQAVITAYNQKISSRVNSHKRSVIIVIMQRLHHLDLTGHLLSQKKTPWVQVCIPMEYEAELTYNADLILNSPHLNDPRKEGELLFPDLFDEVAIESLKETMGDFVAAGQLQQRPTAKGGGILKSHWWRIWDSGQALPLCDHVFVSWDTAFSESDKKQNSFSASTEWGIFWNIDQQRDCLILLNVWYGQVAYPDLRRKAISLEKELKPDCHLIEKKASGQSLIQDLKQAGIKIRAYSPDRDKLTRAYVVQSLLESGQVYVPDRKWAMSFVGLLETFPNGVPLSNDLTDTFTQAALYLKNRWHVTNPDDLDLKVSKPKKYGSAYG